MSHKITKRTLKVLTPSELAEVNKITEEITSGSIDLSVCKKLRPLSATQQKYRVRVDGRYRIVFAGKEVIAIMPTGDKNYRRVCC